MGLLSKPLTLKEVLETYNHIDLTDDEVTAALIWAKRKKAEETRVAEYKKFQEQNRRLREMQWSFDMIKTYMMKRAEKLFQGKFLLDEVNEKLFDILCYYFIGDEENFINQTSKYGTKNPSLKKGILIPGNYGTGKTWIVNLFSRNARQSYDVVMAKVISQQYLNSKEKEIPDHYLRPLINQEDVWYPSDDVFNQKAIGLCIDDLGSEEVKNNFGNKLNVIGDLIESRYASGYTGLFLHATTNMTAEGIKEFYGERVSSRMREIFNIIELKGTDRRK
jgi:DNA replication protein DnaC